MISARGKKRSWSVSCVHQRCYSCQLQSHHCSLCLLEPGSSPPKVSKTKTMSTQNTQSKVIGPTSLSESKCHEAEYSDISHESGFSSEANLSFPSRSSGCDDKVGEESDAKSNCAWHSTETMLSPGQDSAELRPLYFEVAQASPAQLSGRGWVWEEVVDTLTSPATGVVVTGSPGTGKTSLVLAMVQHSCFGSQDTKLEGDDPLSLVGECVVGYHFCQADNSPTCLIPEFVHSLSAQLSQAPLLSHYHSTLQSHPHLLDYLSLDSCISSPSTALVKGILEPLSRCQHEGGVCVIVVDGLCEAEQHRPDHGDTIATFLANHFTHFPPWLKLVCTIRSSHTSLTMGMDMHTIR
jgi:hypothetical protein